MQYCVYAAAAAASRLYLLWGYRDKAWLACELF